MRKFFVRIVRTILGILIFSGIFMLVIDTTWNSTFTDLYSDIYNHGNQPSKETVLEKLDIVCTNIYGSNYYSIAETQELCNNKDKLAEIKSTCQSYVDLQGQNEEIQQACDIALSGEIDRSCAQLNSINFVNMSLIESTCLSYKNDQITDSEFFTKFMLSVTEIPSNKGPNWAIYTFAAALIGLILLFFLCKNQNELLYNIGRISFSIGMNLVIFQVIIYLVKKFLHIDSSIILTGFGQGLPAASLVKESLPIIIPLMFFRLLDLAFLIVGLILVISGFIIKKAIKRTSNI